MPFKDVLPPSSVEYLQKLFQSVFIPAKLGQHTNILTFAGAGKWANLNFLSDYAQEIEPTYPKNLYLYLNAKRLAYQLTDELRNGLLFMHSRAQQQGNNMLAERLMTTIKTSTIHDFIRSIMHIINSTGQRLIIFIDSTEYLTQKNRKSQIALATLSTLTQLHTGQMSFIFITKGELPNDLSHIGRLQTYLTQHIVTERQIPHDTKCVNAYIKRFERTRKVKFTQYSKANLQRLTQSMPLISKYLIQQYHSEIAIKTTLNKRNAPPEAIFVADTDNFIKKYFERLNFRLSSKSRDSLYGIINKPTKYLIDSNLVRSSGEIINPLLSYYIQEIGQRYTISNGIESLSPQEKRIFILLQDNLGNIVDREEIARNLWHNQWQNKFSEQSIDKVISNIRTKLAKTEFTVTSVKGLGIILERTIL